MNLLRSDLSARLAPLLVVLLTVAGCADRMVKLQYTVDQRIERLDGARQLTVFRFADRRGSEGDGDEYRVGGFYGGYGNRVAKVMTDMPWPRTLTEALAAGFKARGVEAFPLADREFSPGVTFATPLALGGEIRNFSTEARFTNAAHISGIVRLYDHQGRTLVDKPLSAREQGGLGGLTVEPLEELLNRALVNFIRQVITDPDVNVALRSR